MRMMGWFVLAVAWLTVTMLMGMLGRSVGRKARLRIVQQQVDRDADEAMAILKKAGIVK